MVYSKPSLKSLFARSIKAVLGLALAISFNAQAADDLSLSEILSIQTKVASLRAMTPREAPGIVSVVTDEDIKKSGSRDFIDVLRMLPGFYFGTDVLGAIGLISRGFWTYEGKVLITVDGLAINEGAYGAVQLGNHLPVDQIKRVEIIRGPGSAIYGGWAGLNVINIITKSGEDLQGYEATVTSGKLPETYGHNNLSVIFGKKVEDLEASVAGYIGRSNLSNFDYTDYYGNEVNMGDGSRRNPHFLNGSMKYKGFEFRVLQDYYRTTGYTGFGEITRKEERRDYITQVFNVKDTYTFGSFKITPMLDYHNQLPYWREDTVDDRYIGSGARSRNIRKKASLLFEYEISDKMHFLLGGEKLWEESTELWYWNTAGDPGKYALSYDKSTVNATNLAYFTQFMFMSDFANVTAGMRADIPSLYERTMVPRLAITKAYDAFHFKLLFAKSFRSPNLGSAGVNDPTDEIPDVVPEVFTTYEVETGYKYSDSGFISLNVFDTKVKKPMAYTWDPDNFIDGYFNYEKANSQGAELEYRYISNIGNLYANYSTYRAKSNDAEPLEPTGNDKVIYGAPKSMANFRFAWQAVKNLFVQPAAHYISKIYSMEYSPEVGDLDEVVQDKKVLYDFYVYSRGMLLAGLDIGLGCNNITNVEETFTQPYVKSGWHPPLPGTGRELFAKVSYSKNF